MLLFDDFPQSDQAHISQGALRIAAGIVRGARERAAAVLAERHLIDHLERRVREKTGIRLVVIFHIFYFN